MARKIFSYEEAAALLPDVQRLTGVAVSRVDELGDDAVEEYQGVIERWAEDIIALGIEVKGLWLIDFDNGSGYYCWQWPEPSLQFFHGYEEGYGGRVMLQ